MPEAVMDTRPKPRDWSANIGRLVRRIAAVAILGVVLVIAFAAAGVIMIAALAIALSVAAGLSLLWLWRRVTGRPNTVRFTVWSSSRSRSQEGEARAPRGSTTLEAHKGPRGWTVETERRGA